MFFAAPTRPFSLARPPLTGSLEAAVEVLRTTSSCRSDPLFLTENVTLPAVTDLGLAFKVNSSMATLVEPPARAALAGTRAMASAPTRTRRYETNGMAGTLPGRAVRRRGVRAQTVARSASALIG